MSKKADSPFCSFSYSLLEQLGDHTLPPAKNNTAALDDTTNYVSFLTFTHYFLSSCQVCFHLPANPSLLICMQGARLQQPKTTVKAVLNHCYCYAYCLRRDLPQWAWNLQFGLRCNCWEVLWELHLANPPIQDQKQSTAFQSWLRLSNWSPQSWHYCQVSCIPQPVYEIVVILSLFVYVFV